jgi:hypothetical protein
VNVVQTLTFVFCYPFAIPKQATRSSRRRPGAAIDVSRIEHENITNQVDRSAQGLARVERELADLRKEVSDLRRLIERLTANAS